MANPDHLAILKKALAKKDIDIWNQWREDNPEAKPDLSRIYLSEADLSGANLSRTKLTRTQLNRVNLKQADLMDADVIAAHMMDAELRWANLSRTRLTGANLSGATLTGAHLVGANLSRANLSGANLSEAHLNKAECGYTRFGDIDLSQVIGLESINHTGPSTIGIDTLEMSRGKIPIEFLEGCGVSKHIIENMQYFVDIPAIQYYSCFISYSTQDEAFSQELQSFMKREGLRVWFAPEEMKAGRKIHEQLYEAIRYHDKLVLVLSEASMKSKWVQLEIKRARQRELREERRLLFPVSLVPFQKLSQWQLITTDGEDLADEIRQYYIPDFSNWKNYNHDQRKTEFNKLIDALKAE